MIRLYNTTRDKNLLIDQSDIRLNKLFWGFILFYFFPMGVQEHPWDKPPCIEQKKIITPLPTPTNPSCQNTQ